jgi:hypothetical protein
VARLSSTACVSKPSRSWRYFVFEHLIPLRPAALESPWRRLVQLHRVHCALLIEEQAFRGGAIRLRRLDLARNALRCARPTVEGRTLSTKPQVCRDSEPELRTMLDGVAVNRRIQPAWAALSVSQVPHARTMNRLVAPAPVAGNALGSTAARLARPATAACLGAGLAPGIGQLAAASAGPRLLCDGLGDAVCRG